LCHEFVRFTTHLFVAATGAGLPFSEIPASNPRSRSLSRVPSSRSRGQGGRSSSQGLLGQSPERLGHGVQGLGQKRRVVTVGRGDYGPERNAAGVHRRQAFDVPFPPIHGAPPALHLDDFSRRLLY
jgi:hypothetical protein